MPVGVLRDPLPGFPRVCVVGLGATGVAAANFLARTGHVVRAIDGRDGPRPDALDPRVTMARPTHDWAPADAVVLSPGVNPEWPEHTRRTWMADLLAARARGEVAVVSEVELGASAFAGRLMTIGGTDGKSTTAAMAAHLLESLGLDAVLGGNSWRPFSEVLVERPGARHAVIEVSAFQLWEPHSLAQRVGILTNIAPDHLDHYDSEAAYVAAKWQAFRNTAAGGTAVLYADDARLTEGAAALRARGLRLAGFAQDRPDGDWDARGYVDGGALVVEDETGQCVVPAGTLRVPGPHNRRNALAAWLAALALADDPAPLRVEDDVAAAFASFVGLPHRVAWVASEAGVDWYDDSKATNVHAAVTGLRSFDRPVVAIVGGVDKGLALDALFEQLARGSRAVVAIGAITGRLLAEAPSSMRIVPAGSMADAVDTARSLAVAGDAVVLSPACSSFDMYAGFEARGRDYADCVRRALGVV